LLGSCGNNHKLQFEFFFYYADMICNKRNSRSVKKRFAALIEREIAMLCLLVIGMLVASIPIYRSQLKAAAFIDFIVVAAILALRVVPGTAHLVDWVLMGIFFLDGSVFFFTSNEVLT
jgi:hypothetical protein